MDVGQTALKGQTIVMIITYKWNILCNAGIPSNHFLYKQNYLWWNIYICGFKGQLQHSLHIPETITSSSEEIVVSSCFGLIVK